MPQETLDIISVNLWQMAASLLSLLLLFLVVKKFLYKPIKKMLNERQSTIEGNYEAAEKAKEEALNEKLAYEEKMPKIASSRKSLTFQPFLPKRCWNARLRPRIIRQ